MTAPRPPRRHKLTAKRVRELLDCDPLTGTLIWKARSDAPRQWNTRYAGKPAGCLRKKDGYLTVRVDGVAYLAHRLVFLHQKGYWPPATLDHFNGVRAGAGNALSNLRPASIHQNNMNLDRNHIRKKRAHPAVVGKTPSRNAGRFIFRRTASVFVSGGSIQQKLPVARTRTQPLIYMASSRSLRAPLVSHAPGGQHEHASQSAPRSRSCSVPPVSR
jgi:hypothetical protein